MNEQHLTYQRRRLGGGIGVRKPHEISVLLTDYFGSIQHVCNIVIFVKWQLFCLKLKVTEMFRAQRDTETMCGTRPPTHCGFIMDRGSKKMLIGNAEMLSTV